MAISAVEVRVLSRLLDQAMALPPDQLDAWIAQLPPAQQALAPRLRERLAQISKPVQEALASAPPPRLQPVLQPDPRQGERVGPYRLLHALSAAAPAPAPAAAGARAAEGAAAASRAADPVEPVDPVDPVDRADRAEIWLVERADDAARRPLALMLPARAAAPADPAAPGQPAARPQKRQVTSLPEHPHLTRLCDAGIDSQGRLYRVMAYIEGADVVAHAQRRRLDVAERLRLLLPVFDALAHAHAEQLAHGDIRRSRLRVDEEGRITLLDWGCGRLLHAATASADLQALAQVLRALCPKPGPDLAAVLRRAERGTATVLAPAPGLTPGPQPGSVQALADDLRRVLAHRPVVGDHATTWHRARLFGRRQRVALGAGTLAVLLLAVAATLGGREWQRGQGQAQRADEARAYVQQALPDDPTLDPALQAARLQTVLEQARAGFAGQPVLRGQVLTELGARFRALGQPEQAQTVLREALALLLTTAAADDPALQAVRAQIALPPESALPAVPVAVPDPAALPPTRAGVPPRPKAPQATAPPQNQPARPAASSATAGRPRLVP